MSSITAANAVITIAVTGLYTVPQQLQGFSADNVYDLADQTVTETSMGVDGILSGGMVFNPIEQTFVMQADSPSCEIFERWAAAQKRIKDVYVANGFTILPSLNKKYTSTKGFLVTLPPLPSAARTLQPRRFAIRWQSVQSTPNS